MMIVISLIFLLFVIGSVWTMFTGEFLVGLGYLLFTVFVIGPVSIFLQSIVECLGPPPMSRYSSKRREEIRMSDCHQEIYRDLHVPEYEAPANCPDFLRTVPGNDVNARYDTYERSQRR